MWGQLEAWESIWSGRGKGDKWGLGGVRGCRQPDGCLGEWKEREREVRSVRGHACGDVVNGDGHMGASWCSQGWWQSMAE